MQARPAFSFVNPRHFDFNCGTKIQSVLNTSSRHSDSQMFRYHLYDCIKNKQTNRYLQEIETARQLCEKNQDCEIHITLKKMRP